MFLRTVIAHQLCQKLSRILTLLVRALCSLSFAQFFELQVTLFDQVRDFTRQLHCLDLQSFPVGEKRVLNPLSVQPL